MADKKPRRRKPVKSTRAPSAQRENKLAAIGLQGKPTARKKLVARQQGGADVQDAQRLLLAITRVQALFIEEGQPAEVFGLLLQELLTLTDSEYGFIGEVDRTPEGQPFLRTHAITDIAWNVATKELMAREAPTLVFRNLKTLFGHVMTTGKPVITNDPAHDPRAGGLPPGHPPMHAFLGLPFSRGELMTGMVGIANRLGGYDEALVTYLEPFLSTCAQLLEGFRHRRLREEAELALRESEERWHLAVQGSRDGIWDWDLTSSRVYFSPRWREMLGYEDHEILGNYQEWESRLHPDDLERVTAQLTTYLEGRAPQYHVEFRLRKKNGEYSWIEARGKAIWAADGRPTRMAGSHTDITARKQAEQALHDAHLAVELAMEGISKLDDAGHYVFVNTQYAALLGYRPEELIGQSWEVTVPPDDRGPVGEAFKQMLAVGRAEAEIRGVKKDGTLIYKHAVIVKPGGRGGHMPGHFCFVRDITQRKREEALQSAEKQALEMVAKGAGLEEVLTFICRTVEAHTGPMLCSVMLVTEDGGHLSSAAGPSLPDEYNRMVHGIPIGPTIGSCGSAAYFKKPSIVVDISTDPRWKDYAPLAATYGLKACWSHPIIGSTGDLLGTFAAYYRELRSPQPMDLAIVERASHITAIAIEHTRITEARQESEARFQVFMRHTPAVTFIKDAAGRHVYINPKSDQLFGVSMEVSQNRTVFELMPEEVAARLYRHDQAVLSSGHAREVEETILAADGTARHWFIMKFPLELPQGRQVGGIAIDITARKRAEAAREILQYAVDNAMEGFALLDELGRYTYMNQAHAKIYGFQASELTGRSWKTLYDKDQIALIESVAFPVLQVEGAWHGELIGKMNNGTLVYVEVGLQRLPSSVGLPEVLLCTCRDITIRKKAEETLQRIRFAMEQAVDAVYWIDPQAKILYSNAAASAMLGYTTDEFLRMTVHDLNPDFPAEVWPGFWEETRAKKVISLETVHRTKDGRRIPIDIRVSFLAYEGQEFHCAFVRDLSERQRAEEELRASRERFELASRATNDGIWDWDILTGEQYWSDRHFELFGLEREDFIPTYQIWLSLVHPDDAERVHQATCRHIETREPYDIEIRVRVKDGRYRWFRDRGQAVWDATGQPVRMVGSISDVTERRAVHEELEQQVVERTAALHRSEQAYAALVNNADGIILEYDPTTARITFVSQQAERILGYPAEQWLDDPMFWVDHIHPDDRQWAPAYCQDMTRQGLNHQFEYRMLAQNGRIVWIKDVVSLMYDDHGHMKLSCILLDVTKQKETVERLRLTQYAVDQASDQIFVIGSDGFFRDVNESACRRLGYTKQELLTMSVMDIDPDFPVPAWSEAWGNLTRVGQLRLETRHRGKSGEIYPVEVVANYLNHEGQELNYAVVRDITERRHAEAAIRDSELRYKLLTESTFDGIAIHDQGSLLEVNAGLERMFGYEPGELVGRSLWDLIAEESQAVVMANMTTDVNGPYEAIGRHKDGSLFPVEVVVRPYRYHGKDVRLVAGRDITARKHLEEERFRHTEELERQVLERTAEIAKLEAQRAQAEKLAALGRLAAGVAHEINNPIAGIKNAFTLVRQAVDSAHPNAEFAGLIDREIARVASIIQNMYQLCRPESRKAETVDLSGLVKDLDILLAPQLQQRRLKFVAEMGRGPRSLCVPRGDLVQVLLNLLTNAIDCSPEGETITLSLQEDEKWIQLAVCDQGGGIEPEHLPRIFDPFYTTKTGRDQKGMGLGLSVSQSLVQAMGGMIEVNTQPGRGSIFTVLLPGYLVDVRMSDQSNIIKEVVTHDR